MKAMMNAVRVVILGLMLAAGTAVHAAPVHNENSAIGAKLNLPVHEWIDDSVPRRGTIVAMHALMMYAAGFDDIARHLAKEGYAVYALDQRGFGRWLQEASAFNAHDRIDFVQSKKDIETLTRQLRQDLPRPSRLICLGESFGADSALELMEEPSGEVFDGAILCAPGFRRRVYPDLRLVFDTLRGFLHPKTQYDVTRYVDRYLARNGDLTKTWMQDESILRLLTMRELIKVIHLNQRAMRHVRRVNREIPILILAGQQDQAYNSLALRHFARKLGSNRVQLKLMQDQGHLLLEAQQVAPETKQAIDRWLEQTAKE